MVVAQGNLFLHDDLGDRYAVERELGHGGTATVYNGRPVAIKILFIREIKTTALLSHPHI